MKHISRITLLALAITAPMYADDTWAAFSGGVIHTAPGFREHSFPITWPSAEFSIGRSQADNGTRLIRGWSVGVRKDNRAAFNGTYATLRCDFRPIRTLKNIRPSTVITYGAPGFMLDRSWESRDERGDQVSFGRVSPTRMVDTPLAGVARAGIISPAFLVATRIHIFKDVYAEPTAGLHLIRFNASYGNFTTDTTSNRDRWEIAPSVGLRVCIRMWKGATP